MQEAGISQREVRKALRQAAAQDFAFDGHGRGTIVGSMCTQPHSLAATAYAEFLPTNLGDPDHFPGTARLEREVLDDLLQLMHAPTSAAGRYLTGGTEANLLACYLAREATGHTEIVLPESGHFSFEKAARMLGMELVVVPTAASGHADVAAMGKAIGKKTALVVGIAGTTELGLVDPIAQLAQLARRRKVRLHVDAAYGGYLLPFLEDAGRRPVAFDFRLAGVTSISLDPHKVGMAPIPGGVLLVRDAKDWDRLAVRSPYVSTETQSTILGTRPGAAAAACWAVHRHLGRKGYASVAEDCLDNAAFLAAQLQDRGYALVAAPELAVVTFRHEDPKGLQGKLERAGWRINVIPRMQALRVVVNPHLNRGALTRFLAALEEVDG